MKFIINVPQHLHAKAFELLTEQAKEIERYDRPGWGWSFYIADERVFVRGIKGGLSISLSKTK